MLTLTDLQTEHEKWIDYNFPEETTYQAFLGMVEEMGELAHAMLKSEQAIREGADGQSLYDEKVDAVGDLVIFLAGFCTRHDIDLQIAVETTWAKVKQRDWVADPVSGGEHGN